MTINSAWIINDQALQASNDAFNDRAYGNDDLFRILKTAILDSACSCYTTDEMIALINKRCDLK